MTIGKATALTAAFVGAVALGVWVGPYLDDRDPATPDPVADSAPAQTETPRAAPTTAARRSAPAERPALVEASDPELQKRLKPVLNTGTNVTLAAQGFRNGEEFATVAHAARNTGVPFAVLKHRVLVERKTLAAAIREMKPELDAVREANRARSMARADVAASAT
jgi:hypothetical protein